MSFTIRLHSGGVLLMDGAMGTQLQARGARLGVDCLELWNLTRSSDVRGIHASYSLAGAEVALTQTFQANPSALKRHGLEAQLADIWTAALGHARSAARFVLADVGPLSQEDAEPVFAACAGADGILLETWSRPKDIVALASKAKMPLLVSFAFRRDDLRTLAGATPEACAQTAAVVGAVALGVNCGIDIDMASCAAILRRMRTVTDLPLFARPNAGTPVAGVYPRTREILSAGLPELLEAGVAMVGGCCGTTPAHIAAFRGVIDGRSV